ncbi:MAG: aminotransferase class V-fold PLP-dependent enzyme [Candidatus Omnitrophica bacterium]|nr:aminotransferase class V-fold PLP-dependent enzyme [Candidatus Omnitrophota bacterium]
MAKRSQVKKWVLMNPGPVNVTSRVRRSLGGPDICHREEEFFDLLDDLRRELPKVLGAARTHEAAFLTGSGTAAVESMLVSFDPGRGSVLVLSNGVYGERMARILETAGVRHSVLTTGSDRFFEFAEIERELRRDPSICALAMVHHETSTGILNPLPMVARIARRLGKTLLLDAVSSLGGERLDFKVLGASLVAGTSGKCLHGYPGVSFVLVSGGVPLRKRPRSVYLDLGGALAKQRMGDVSFTPAVQLFYALHEALSELKLQGLESRVRSYQRRSRVLEQGLTAAGCRFVVPARMRSHVLHAMWLPDGASYRALHDGLKQRGFIIYAGQSRLASKIFRISNLGETDEAAIQRFLTAFREVLRRERSKPRPRAILLAAGAGRRLGMRHTPKCLVPIGPDRKPLLERYFEAFRQIGIRDVVVVTGFESSQVEAAISKYAAGLRVKTVLNPVYRRGSILSLRSARKYLDRSVLIMDADVFFETEALGRLVGSKHASAFLADPGSVSGGEEMMLGSTNGRLSGISKKPDPRFKSEGEATGILRLSRTDAVRLKGILEDFYRRNVWDCEYEESLAVLMKKSRLNLESVAGTFWTEMDFAKDLERINAYLADHAGA